jgi:hypothetical protein
VIDNGAGSGCKRGDTADLGKEGIPGFTARVDNVPVGLEQFVSEVGLAQILPDVLLWLQLRAVRRQGEDGEVAWFP